MDLLSLIKERKSIRRFKKLPIPDDVIRYILYCGINSPSACNVQPYRFVVLRGDFKDRFCSEVFSGIYSPCKFVSDAGVIIAIVRVKDKVKMRLAEIIVESDFSLIDIGIAGQQMILAATEKGFGSLWVGWFDRGKAGRLLNVARNERVEILIAIGYKDEEPPQRKKKSFDEIVSFVE